VLLKVLSGAALAVLGYIGCTTAAIGPHYGTADQFTLAPAASASLERLGADATITGSVAGIFSSATFSGPNRAEKQDRARPIVDVVEMASGFVEIRARLASLRMPAPPAAGASTEATESAVSPAPTRVAAIDPSAGSAALDAIDEAAGGGAPIPRAPSQKLAYARADAPLTIFDGTLRDKRGNKVSAKELNCLATAIYFEARGESDRGQIAVGQVILNRVAHNLYPGTICSVVYQNQHRRNACQFSFACDGIPDRVTERKPWDKAEDIAKGVIAGELYLTEVGPATHYHATYVKPHWAPRMTKVTQVGLHIFYQFKRGWRFG
jgi:spore germination cell wall hydrolase CwlJ-like protein